MVERNIKTQRSDWSFKDSLFRKNRTLIMRKSDSENPKVVVEWKSTKKKKKEDV
jgi:hypothetical protein